MDYEKHRLRWIGGEHDTETTFALIKTHAIAEGLLPAILNRIIGEGFIIVVGHIGEMTGAEVAALYYEHSKMPYWPELMRSVFGLVLPLVLKRHDAVRHWRNVLGNKHASLAKTGTLRAEFGSRIIPANNVAHGSDSRRSADREIGLFFPTAILVRGSAASVGAALSPDDPAEKTTDRGVPTRDTTG